MRKHYNPERRDFRGRSYKKWGELIARFRDKVRRKEQRNEQEGQ